MIENPTFDVDVDRAGVQRCDEVLAVPRVPVAANVLPVSSETTRSTVRVVV